MICMEYSNFELKSKIINGKHNIYVKVVSTGKMLYVGEISYNADIHKLYGVVMGGLLTLTESKPNNSKNFDCDEKDLKVILDAMDYLLYLDKFMKSN